jgi:N-acetylmuramoyl-L-alanine amidase
MNRLFALGACLVFMLSSCAVPGGGGSTRDYWGHRAGPQGFRTVVIDAGHGGKDSGAISRSTGLTEKFLALDTARRLESLLDGQFRVVMLRDSDTFIDLDERATRASRYGDGIFLSIHFNHGPSSISGAETFYWRVDSFSLAKRAQQELRAVTGGSGSRGLVRRRLRLTRNPQIPSILVECGYLSNPSEARRAADPAYRQRLAQALARAIRTQAARGDAGNGPLPRPINAPPSRPSDARE